MTPSRLSGPLALLLLAGTAARGATLSIDAAPAHRRAINPRIYGVNIANWCQAYYLDLCAPLLVSAKVAVVRYGATNIERYNWRNNRMYNVISLTNQFVPLSWESFVNWVRADLGAEPFLQASVFGHVASDYGAADYNTNQTPADVAAWVAAAGTNVPIWGVGNEPFIAWKLYEYQGRRGSNDESFAYNDGAHGDQIYNEDIAADRYYPQFIRVAEAIRNANPAAKILGPTPANWWLYWSTDYSPFCPATRANPGAHTNANGWYLMAAAANQWDPNVFPDRGGNPSLVGWEMNTNTLRFNDARNMCRFAQRAAEYAATHGGTQVVDYLDFHRYMNCDQDAVAVQEVRDLWDPDYASYDKETGGSGTKTEILTRFQRILDHYNTNMALSLSEYDYFYWQGHPAEPQIAALGQIDYLGTFARHGVQLACNWYIGEPAQSGGGYHHAADSAKQALFTETGAANPKYWALRLMSENFRDQSVAAHSSESDFFSVFAGLDTAHTQLTVVAHYKGAYYPWWDAHNPGGFIEGQAASNATMVISNFTITGVQRVQRFGRFDPYIVPLATGTVSFSGNAFTYSFQPLAIYLFTFHGSNNPPPETAPATYLHVNPTRVDFGPYETGIELLEETDEHTGEVIGITTNYTAAVKITNNRRSNTTWTVATACPWLQIIGGPSGTATVTDVIYLQVTNKSAYAVGVYTGLVTVTTSEGLALIPVTMEVIPGRTNGETRIFDAETHSLAHVWTVTEPYSVGFYDGHGNTEDRNRPYIYDFAMDYAERSPLGGVASLRVDFDRANGDHSAGRLYTAFGTYGHVSGATLGPTAVWVPTNASPSNYVFKFDVKTKTDGTGFTKTRLLVVITDNLFNQGKPAVGISDFRETMELDDGGWQTVAIPLGGPFYNWKYPGGQDGSLATLDFAQIRQIEFCPWVGQEDKRGTIWLDNLRIETVNAAGDHYPVAVVNQDQLLIGTNATVLLTATNSYCEGDAIAAYTWSPAAGLSASNVASPIFTPPGPGTYTFNLTVTSAAGLKSRNPAQAVIKVIPTLVGQSLTLYRDAALTRVVSGVATNCLDTYVKLVCSAGGNPNEIDFTLARVTTTDTWTPELHNHVNPIDIVLEETGADTQVFTGHFRIGAFSDALNEIIGAAEGTGLTVSNAGVAADVTVGAQTYGYEKIVDHVEQGDNAFNTFEGTWYTYTDNYNHNTSMVSVAVSNVGCYAGSSQSMRGAGVLRLGPTGSVDQLFAGFATKLTRRTDETTNAVCDLSSPTGARGVSFWLKGNGNKLAVVLRSFAITNYDDYLYTIDYTPSNGWRKYHLLFTDFRQEGWGSQAVERDTALKLVNAVQFKFASKINNETNEVFIDELALIGGQIAYSSNVIYHKENTISMEGYAGMALVNPSFTNAGGSATAIHGWTLSGNVRGEDWGANGGDAVFEWWNGGVGAIYQAVTNIRPGAAYRFSAEMTKSADFAGSIYMEMIWLTAADAIISTNATDDIAPDITTADWPYSSHNTGWVTSPTNAAKVWLQVRSASVTAGNTKVHDAAISGTQQPDNQWYTDWISGFAVTYTTNRAEGERAAHLDTTNTDWVAGMYVPRFGEGQTLTNFTAWSGLAIKGRRPPDYAASGATNARIRLSIVTNTTEVAKTRWYPVDAGQWGDYIIFSKDNFFTLETADTNDPAALVTYTGAWDQVDRVYIYYGPKQNGATPFDIILDDFRPCTGNYVH